MLYKMYDYPSNRGYIFSGGKQYGDLDPVDEGKNIILVEPGLWKQDENGVNIPYKRIHMWIPTGYITYEVSSQYTDIQCWNSESKPMGPLTVQKMTPCQEELKNNGRCDKIHDPDHMKEYYHFTSYLTVDGIDKPVCKYFLNANGKYGCWEKDTENHCEVFHHII